jgi:hypothetical protein
MGARAALGPSTSATLLCERGGEPDQRVPNFSESDRAACSGQPRCRPFFLLSCYGSRHRCCYWRGCCVTMSRTTRLAEDGSEPASPATRQQLPRLPRADSKGPSIVTLLLQACYIASPPHVLPALIESAIQPVCASATASAALIGRGSRYGTSGRWS